MQHSSWLKMFYFVLLKHKQEDGGWCHWAVEGRDPRFDDTDMGFNTPVVRVGLVNQLRQLLWLITRGALLWSTTRLIMWASPDPGAGGWRIDRKISLTKTLSLKAGVNIP